MDDIPPGFEWDPRKARANLRKHGVSFREAATVFGDPHVRTQRDLAHSHTEDREVSIGLSVLGRLVAIAYTYRGRKIRIISARPAYLREEQQYEQTRR